MKTDCIVVPSFYFKEILENTEHKIFENIIISPSGGVNTNIFYLKNHNFPRNIDKITITYTSRLEEGKGWKDFLIAVKRIVKTSKNICVKIIGYGSEYKMVTAFIEKDTVLSKNIEILISPSQELIADIYNESDIFIFPTRLPESLGLVALEAMSCGLPVIGSRIGAIPEYLKDGYNGYLFEAGDVGDLSQKIDNFIKLSDNKKKEMSDCAICTSTQYASSSIAKEFIKNLNLVI
jgi:glycosyltransferase involved in cell wall biosynthesis